MSYTFPHNYHASDRHPKTQHDRQQPDTSDYYPTAYQRNPVLPRHPVEHVPAGHAPAGHAPAGRAPGPSTSGETPPGSIMDDAASTSMLGGAEFDIFAWYPAYQSCQRYFLDHAQWQGQIQAVAALVNICLPFQWNANPLVSSTAEPANTGPSAYNSMGAAGWPRTVPPMMPGRAPAMMPYPQNSAPPTAWVSLVPYIRRLVITGFDSEGIMHGFFGDDWRKGAAPMQECERRNYLFLAKGIGMNRTKAQYDMSPHETVPFMKPLANVTEAEIQAAEKQWSTWLSMEDWMLGDRAPDWIFGDRAPDRMRDDRDAGDDARL